MKNKKGFTLIELLAVVVVLAIIALIATPIVMNTIKNAKKGAAERSADNYIKQVETAVAESRIDGTKIANGDYQIQSDGNLCPLLGCGTDNKDKITIDMSGNKPTSGIIKIENGGVSSTDTTMTVGDYDISYKDKKLSAIDMDEISKQLSDKICVNVSGDTAYSYGAKYICDLGDGEKRTFYMLEDGDTTTLANNRIAQAGEVSLIMNANIGADGKALTSESTDKGTVAWCTASDWSKAGGVVTDEMKSDKGACQYGKLCLTNRLGPITANEELSKRTSGWDKITNKEKITLPNVYQIAQASGLVFNNSSTSLILPLWIHENINNMVKNQRVSFYGYWTSTPEITDNMNAWLVYKVGASAAIYHVESSSGITYTGAYGIRPVITISKSNLS